MQPSDAYSFIRLPPSDRDINKQEQFTPKGREPSELLALMSEYWRYSMKERQEQKAQVSIKVRTGSNAQFIS